MSDEKPKSVALISDERTKGQVKHTEKSEAINHTGMPEHRNIERVYHEVDVVHKEMLTQKLIDEAIEKLGGDEFKKSVNDAETLEKPVKILGWEFKNWARKTTLDEYPPSDKPQIFKEKIPGSERDYRVYIRLNNGEPNTVVIMDGHNNGGKFSLDLAKEKGFFHVTTEKKVDQARKGGMFSGSGTPEGKWIKGEINSVEYQKLAKEKRKMDPRDFWKQNDKDRLEFWGPTRIRKWREKTFGNKYKDRREQGEDAIEDYAERNSREKLDNIWYKEDLAFEEKQKEDEENEKVWKERTEKFAEWRKGMVEELAKKFGVKKKEDEEEEVAPAAPTTRKKRAATGGKPGSPKVRRKKIGSKKKS